MSDDGSLPVDDQHLQHDGRIAKNSPSLGLGVGGDDIGEWKSGRLGETQHFVGGVCVSCYGGQGFGSAKPEQLLRKPSKVNLAASGVQIEVALREFGEFAEAAADCEFREGMLAEVLEQAADEIAHVEHRFVRESVASLYGFFAGGTGASGHMREARGTGDVNAALDRVNPRRAGVRDDDSGRAEDGESAHDAETRIPGVLRQFLAVGDGQRDDDIPGAAVRCGDLADDLVHQTSRHRVDRRFSGGDRQSGLGDLAHAGTGLEPASEAGMIVPDSGHDQRTVGDIGIVACVLDDCGGSPAVTQFLASEGEGRGLAFRQGNADRIGKRPREQCRVGGFGRSSRAGTSGPATSQGSGGFAGHVSFGFGEFR